MTSSASKKRSAPATEDSALTIKRRRRTKFGNSSMITRSQTLSAARNAVLHTTELLENILYFLPMKDLLFAQRVCTKWRELIQRSVPLQEALFFRPRELGIYWKLVEEPDAHPKLVKIKQEEYLQGQAGKVFKAAIPSPLLCTIDVFGKSRAQNECPHNAWFKGRPSALYPEACWRKMLIAQAPTCLFRFYFEYRVDYENPSEHRKPYYVDGFSATLIFPDSGNAEDVLEFVEEVEAEEHVIHDNGYVKFPNNMFTTEGQLEMDVLE
ncbi:hypothetical protein KC361_g5256 [Hortaea werneckii]|nr:hypothetical protein KC361_g5256 [Hortaea werneckii]